MPPARARGCSVEVWTHVVASRAYNGAKAPKTVIEEVLNTDPKYAGISDAAGPFDDRQQAMMRDRAGWW